MSIELNAELRTDKGKGASRRLRREKKVPAILYGFNKDAVSITLLQKDIQHELGNEAFYSQVLQLNVAGDKEDVLLKDLQHHPAKQDILHVDFQRVDAKTAVHVHIPLHFINEEKAPGVKLEDGAVSHIVNEVEVECLPGKIPEYIEVDLGGLHVGDSIHLSELKLPEGVEILALKHDEDQQHDIAIANIHVRKVAPEPEEEEAAEEAEAEAAAKEEAKKEEDDEGEGEGEAKDKD